MSIRAKLTLLLSGFALVVAVCGLSLTYVQMRRAIAANVEAHRRDVAVSIAEKIDRFASERAREVDSWGAQQVMQDIVIDDVDFRIRTAIERLLTSNSFYARVLCLDAKGGVIAASDRSGRNATDGIKMQNASWWPSVVAGGTVIRVVWNREYGGPGILFGAPVYNQYRGNSVLGALVFVVSFDEVAQLASASLSKTLRYSVADTDGKSIASSPALQQPDRGDVLVTAATSPGVPGFSGLGWTVAVAENSDVAFSAIDDLKRNLLITGAVTLTFAIGIGLYVSDRMSQRLKKLVVASREISGGDLQVRVEIGGRDELADLGNTFNRMAESLRAMIERVKQEAKEAQEAHRRRHEAEDTLRVRNEFVAKMSHELRTPLNAILGYSELIIKDVMDSGHQEPVPDLEQIRLAGKHLLRLINDVLDLSKVEAGEMQLHLERFDVRDLVQALVATIRPLAEKNGNTLTTQCATDLGMMYTDATKVQQNLYNLLGNACKFTEKGAISLAVWRETIADRDWVTFRVSDTGIGMSPDQRERLFQAFVQGDASTWRKYGGTGLGLAITQKLCLMMGGTITVASESRKGSAFTMSVPAEHRAPPVEEQHAADQSSGCPSQPTLA